MKKFFISGSIVFLLSSSLSLLSIILWGDLATLFKSMLLLEFYPGALLVSMVVVLFLELLIFACLYISIGLKKKLYIPYRENEFVVFTLIFGFVFSVSLPLPAMLGMIIDIKTEILPFYREMRRPIPHYFIIISAINFLCVSMLVMISRHYTLRSRSE